MARRQREREVDARADAAWQARLAGETTRRHNWLASMNQRRGALKAVAKKLDKLKGEAKKKTTRSQWAELAKRCGRLRNEIAKLYGV